MYRYQGFKPLNKSLHGRLSRAHGRVTVAHELESFVGKPISETDQDAPVTQTGEWYRVDCPICGDTRRRLWVNHQWGVPDDYGNAHWDMAICFNRDCMADETNLKSLIRAVYKGSRPTLRNRPKIRSGLEVPNLRHRGDHKSMLDVRPLSELPSTDPGIQCVRAHGFDPAYLEQRFNVTYWYDSPPRLSIPVYQHRTLILEARLPLESEANWRAKRRSHDPTDVDRKAVLYNLDVASTLPWAILVRHFTDVWRMGDHAVAPLGGSLSERQAHRIAQTWPVLIAMLDDEESYDAAAMAFRSLERRITVVRVELPQGAPPAPYDELWDAVWRAASAQGIDLLSLRRPEPEPVSPFPPPAQPHLQRKENAE